MKVSDTDRGAREAASAEKFVYGFLEDSEIDDVRRLLEGKPKPLILTPQSAENTYK